MSSGYPSIRVTYKTPMSDTTTSRTRKISHPGVRALTKQPLPVYHSLPLTHNSNHTLSTSLWAESKFEKRRWPAAPTYPGWPPNSLQP